jgi:hypothetical protein
VPRDFGHQAGDGGGFDIGGVAEDEVEPGSDRVGPVGADDVRAAGQAEGGGVFGGQGSCGRVPVDPETPRLLEFGERGEQEAAGAGAEVEDCANAVWAQRERGLDQGLAVGAGDEGGGRDPEPKAPELLVAEDERQRLPRGPAGDEGAVWRGVEGTAGIEEDLLAGEAGRSGEEETGFAAGGFDAGGS